MYTVSVIRGFLKVMKRSRTVVVSREYPAYTRTTDNEGNLYVFYILEDLLDEKKGLSS